MKFCFEGKILRCARLWIIKLLEYSLHHISVSLRHVYLSYRVTARLHCNHFIFQILNLNKIDMLSLRNLRKENYASIRLFSKEKGKWILLVLDAGCWKLQLNVPFLRAWVVIWLILTLMKFKRLVILVSIVKNLLF